MRFPQALHPRIHGSLDDYYWLSPLAADYWQYNLSCRKHASDDPATVDLTTYACG